MRYNTIEAYDIISNMVDKYIGNIQSVFLHRTIFDYECEYVKPNEDDFVKLNNIIKSNHLTKKHKDFNILIASRSENYAAVVKYQIVAKCLRCNVIIYSFYDSTKSSPGILMRYQNSYNRFKTCNEILMENALS